MKSSIHAVWHGGKQVSLAHLCSVLDGMSVDGMVSVCPPPPGLLRAAGEDDGTCKCRVWSLALSPSRDV